MLPVAFTPPPRTHASVRTRFFGVSPHPRDGAVWTSNVLAHKLMGPHTGSVWAGPHSGLDSGHIHSATGSWQWPFLVVAIQTVHPRTSQLPTEVRQEFGCASLVARPNVEAPQSACSCLPGMMAFSPLSPNPRLMRSGTLDPNTGTASSGRLDIWTPKSCCNGEDEIGPIIVKERGRYQNTRHLGCDASAPRSEVSEGTSETAESAEL